MAAEDRAGVDESELPAAFRSVIERWRRLGSASSERADLLAEVKRREREIESLIAPFDAVHILGQLTLSEVVIRNVDSYKESESSQTPILVELLAAVLIRRGSRSGALDVTPAIDARTTSPLRELLHEIWLLEGLRRHRIAMRRSDGIGASQARAALKHVLHSAPGWNEQEEAALAGLFSPPHIAARVSGALGFNVEEALACLNAVEPLLHNQIERHARSAHGESRARALEWASKVLRVRDDAPGGDEFRDRALAAVWALNHYGDAWLFTPEALGNEAGVSPSVAKAVVEALSTPFGQSGELFTIAERLHQRPYIDLGDGSYFALVPGNDLWALRGVLEEALRGDQGYAKHRGRWLERRAAEALASALAPDATHHSVGLFDRSGTQLGEIDALICVGDTVITLEAKSAAQRLGAKRGGEPFVDHLEQTVKKAAEQSSLAQRALRDEIDVELRQANGTRLVLGEDVREVHSVVVTLDDLSSVAPVIWQLTGSHVLPKDVTIPWLVSWYELDLICRLVEWPAQLIHFLRRRSRLNEIGGIHAVEELDWWMLYLGGDFFFEDDEDISAGSEIRFLSQTDELDAWVLWERGDRTTPAPKPRQQLDPETERFLQLLEDHRPPGAIPAACALLDLSSETRESLHRHFADGRAKASERHRVQRGTIGFTSAPRPFLISWVVVPDDGRPVLQEVLRDYIDERLGDTGLMAVVAFGFCASSPHAFDAMAVLEARRWQGSAVPLDPSPR